MKITCLLWLLSTSQILAIIGEYFHAGDCLADKREKAFIKIEKNSRFKAAVWTCDTLLHVGGKYKLYNGNIKFVLDKPWDIELVYKVVGKKLIPSSREKTFYQCGIREECASEKDYYLQGN
jgi:hypothetical protein